MADSKHTPGPWAYIASNANHGPYVTNDWGAGDICDCYAMSNPSALAVCNGGDSKPIHFQHDEADANARLIAAAPDLLEAMKGIEHFKDALNWREDHLSKALRQWIEAGCSAISKAEGRS